MVKLKRKRKKNNNTAPLLCSPPGTGPCGWWKSRERPFGVSVFFVCFFFFVCLFGFVHTVKPVHTCEPNCTRKYLFLANKDTVATLPTAASRLRGRCVRGRAAAGAPGRAESGARPAGRLSPWSRSAPWRRPRGGGGGRCGASGEGDRPGRAPRGTRAAFGLRAPSRSEPRGPGHGADRCVTEPREGRRGARPELG